MFLFLCNHKKLFLSHIECVNDSNYSTRTEQMQFVYSRELFLVISIVSCSVSTSDIELLSHSFIQSI